MFLQNFAQSTAECTVNGQAVDCGDAAKAAGGLLAGFGIFMLVFFALGIFSTVIWILCLIHLVQHEDVENRILWIVLVLLVPLANFVYYFGFKRSYDKQHKGTQAPADAGIGNTPAATPGVVSPQGSSVNNNVATGAVAGGAATAASGFSTPDSSGPSAPSVADNADQQPSSDLGLQDDVSSSGTDDQIAQTDSQADSAPVYSPEESSPDTTTPGSDTTETIAPETDSFQSGSTEESLPSEGPTSQLADTDSSVNGAGDSPGTQEPGADENTTGSSSSTSIG